ncbi:hypothetical protein BDR05DRAFT_1002391 [Suillus weaverae]|nr:hypothetical protein BDR05DRAFT_1002391 [Suillus weaverae]
MDTCIAVLCSVAPTLIAQFIFETARVSRLFCHQIIWNMKANFFKDDAAKIEDPMKRALDRMTDMVADSLSGGARAFYKDPTPRG